jgi:uncharacterized repeat protein (TIGR01451 family)
MESLVRKLAPVSLAGIVIVAGALLVASPAVPAPGDTANLRVTKSDSPDPVTVGSILTYTIQVTNLGPQGATGTTVTDRLPSGVDFVSASASSGSCNRNGRNVTCNIGAVPSATGGNTTPATVTIRVRPRRAGTLSNTAEVDSVENDPVAANNSDTETTRVNEPSTPPPTATCRGIAATIRGTARADTLTGTGGRDVVAAFGGNDQIITLAGQDLVCTGRGSDFVNAGPAADRVFGAAGGDRLLGRGGPDLLRGNDGNDILKGGVGSDRLRGGRGSDTCRGGPGADSFRSC